MTEYHEQVLKVIKAARFVSSSQVFWCGKSVGPALPRRIKRALTPAAIREQVRFALNSQLYWNFFCKGVASPPVFEAHESAVHWSPTPFVKQLSEANSGVGYRDLGWEVRRVDGTTVVVFRNGLELSVRSKDCHVPTGTPLTPGVTLDLALPKELIDRSPGFYAAMGNKIPLDGGESRTVVRVYWNVQRQSAIGVMRMATRRLNEADIPFQLKVLNDPGRLERCDAAVLYLDKGDYPEASGILASIYSEVASDLEPGVPAFTKRLAPGLGLAEDPGPGVSFGEQRCNLLAEALISAHELGKTLPEDRLQVVDAYFQQHSVNLEAPYLNDGSSDTYAFDRSRARQSRARAHLAAKHPEARDGEYLVTAMRIGHHICEEATWGQGRCNWMGATVDSARNVNHRALGPELYDGTSGIALFLSELYAATGEAAVRSTALGAIRQALSKVDTVSPTDRLGLFTGWSGIALASARVGLLTGEEELLSAAKSLLRKLEPAYSTALQYGVISGAAGAIPVLLALGELLLDPSLIEVAERLGNALLERAEKTKNRWSWKLAHASREMNLTGFSHGTAGVACALLELLRLSGDGRYLVAAELAFQYERYWFDADARNWPDFRGYSRRAVRKNDTLPCSAYWCHGAPGIAVSRLRAYEITRDPHWQAEAITALETTRELTERALHAGTMNFSLCHGLAGNAEILLHGSKSIGDAFTGGAKLATDVAAAAIERCRAADNSWPLGAVAPMASLMVGLAGLGYFFLRLENPAIPSILFLEPQSLAARPHLRRSHSDGRVAAMPS